MSTFYIVLMTIVAYSFIATIAYIISKDNEDVAIMFGLGIFGLTLWGILKILYKIKNKFKYHIGKRSIFEEKSTGNKYKCRVKDADDIHCWTEDYQLIKRYATKHEWINIPDFSAEFINNSKKNCNNCKYDKECVCDYPHIAVKCKHDGYGTVLEFDKFESKQNKSFKR